MNTITKLRAEVIINKEYIVQKSDDVFRSFFGFGLSGSIIDRIVDKDQKRFEDMIQSLAKGEIRVECIRLVGKDDNIRSFMVEASEIKGIVTLLFSDIYVAYGELQHMKRDLDMYATFVAMEDQICTRYDYQKDIYTIFSVNGANRTTILYEGSLSTYRDGAVSNPNMSLEDIDSVNHVYNLIMNQEILVGVDIKMVFPHFSDKVLRGRINGRVIEDTAKNKYSLCMVTVYREKDEYKNPDESVMTLGRRDAGTDLYDKRTIINYAKQLIASSPKEHVSIAIIDIDDFKTINDTYGHAFGDEVLADVANIIQESVGTNGMCGRIGGDEMFIVFKNDGTEEGIRSVLRSVKSNIGYLYQNDERNIQKITCSIGSAMYPDDAQNYDELFRIADRLLYLAKEKGKNRYIYYIDELHRPLIEGKEFEINPDIMGVSKYQKVCLSVEFASGYLQAGKIERMLFLERLSQYYSLDSIFVYDLDKRTRKVIYGECDYNENGKFFLKDNYLPIFREDHLMPVSSVMHSERNFPHMVEAFSNMEITQFVQYKDTDLTVNSGKIISFNRKKMLKQWAEIDITQLAIIGSIILKSYS